MMSNSGQQLREGLEAVHNGNLARAQTIVDTLFAADPNDVHALQIIGFLHYRCGRNHEALEAYLRANRVAPNQPAILNWIGDLFKERGDFKQAHKAYSRSVKLAPQHAEAWANLGQTSALLRDPAAAEENFEKAAAITPPVPIVLAQAARFFEDNHKLDKARHYAERAIALEPHNEIAQIAMAEVDIRERHYDAVIQRLSPILSASDPNPRNGAKLFHQLATAFHQTRKYDEAFGAYARANDLQRGLYSEYIARECSPLSPQNLDAMIEFFSSEDTSEWTNHDNFSDPTPVFLVGFLRSGTTWLDQILSSHKDFIVMDEEDNFFDAWQKFLLSADGLGKLKSLTHDEVEHYRDLYWQRAKQHLPADHNARIVVDKVPLNTIQMGLIHRLFPHAKFLFAIRDPRDCVLSCFQQHFAMNAAMYQTLSLDTCTDFYAKVMTLGKLYREKLPLNVHEIRYENLVEDLESELRVMFAFLGADWSNAVLRYYETARERSIFTPSAKQVIQKPYKTSQGKWRNYETLMQPVLPALNQWVTHFGYSTSD